ncbi:MAG: hypothetical protein Q8S18_07145 [Bacteroidales bacterium]|nr:hypothetical protein [Bacteroidales bacterium]
MNSFRQITIQFMLATLLLIILVSGCSKTDEPDTYDVWLPEPLKEIFLMQPGTYWIMQEVATGEQYFDSIFVIETILDTIDIISPGSQKAFARKEQFRVKCVSAFYGREFHYVSQSADLCGSLNNSEPCHFVVVENYSQGNIIASSRIYYYPDQPDEGWSSITSGSGQSKVRITGILDNYTVGEQAYSLVRRVEIDSDPTLQQIKSIRYIAPGYGVIQFEQPEYNTKWITIRKQIIQ